MNILYGANDAYARHLGVSMCSLLDRNQEADGIHVYVLSMGISGANQDSLKKIAGRYGRELTLIEVADLKDKLGEDADTGGYDLSIMLRLFMGEMLPPEVERLIYLDCDTVVTGSLARLWSCPLKGKLVGAVMEPTIYPEVKASIGLEPQDPYYNSGVLLVDLKSWREEGVQQQLLDFWKEKGGKLFASDQDLLNGALKGRFRTLPPRYNFFTNYRYFSYGTLVRHEPSYTAVSRKQFRQAKRHPAVIHYMGDERPWMAGNRNHYRKAYEYYLARTEWAGMPKTPGKEIYMLAYHVLDYVTAVCPAVRWAINRKLGMKLVEGRRK